MKECVVEVALHASFGGMVVWEVGLSFCRAQAKQDSERARESRQARKKGTEGTTRALCYCRGGAPRQVRVAITVPAGRWRWEWRAVARYCMCTVRDPELTDLTFSEG